MAEASFANPPRGPWTLWLYERSPLSPLWVGLGIALAFLVALTLYSQVVAAFGEGALIRSIYFEHGHWRSAMVNAVMMAFAPTFMVYALRGTVEDLRALRPALRCSDAELERLIREVTRLDMASLRSWGGGAVVVMLGFTYFDPGLWSTRARPELTDPTLLWQLARQGLMGWLWLRAIGVDVRLAREFGRVADRIEPVDLLDQRPLLVFARHGARSVLGWMAASAIFSLFWLHPDAGRSNIVGLFCLLGVAGATLFFPIWGIHRRLRAEKSHQLDRVRAAIRIDQAALLGDPPQSAPAAARLPALFASEARILAAQEWPFDVSSLLRIALYVSLGVGSWIGAALVERSLSSVLG